MIWTNWIPKHSAWLPGFATEPPTRTPPARHLSNACEWAGGLPGLSATTRGYLQSSGESGEQSLSWLLPSTISSERLNRALRHLSSKLLNANLNRQLGPDRTGPGWSCCYLRA